MAAPKASTPKDAQVMAAILKDMGIIEYEPRVISQMLEFTYRYVTNILDDARMYSNHAKKKNIDVEDVKLSIQMQMDKSFTTPPPRDILIEIAKQRNNIPLPLIKPHCGPRLPPDRYCLSACNYRIKSSKKPQARQFQIGVPFGSISSTATKINVQPMGAVVSKLNPAVNLPNKGGATLSLVPKGSSAPSVALMTRPAQPPTTSTLPSTPIIKISPGTASAAINNPTIISSSSSSSSSVSSPMPTISASTPMIVTQTIPASSLSNSEVSGKRKREEEDEYDLE